MIKKAAAHFIRRFEEVESQRELGTRPRRIGSELKFPVVREDGRAIGAEQADALWDFLLSKGWDPVSDPLSGKTVGATKPGEMNEHRASCETGFCKVEFSLAHTDSLAALAAEVGEIRSLISEFDRQSGTVFLGFGLQPLTPPGKDLLMQKSRNLFWDRLFGGNEHIPPCSGTDVHLFTISASNQVHVDVRMDEAVDAVNVFNGLAGAQVALTANSNIWQGRIDPDYKCLGEMFWEWWLKEAHLGRYGVPEKKFRDLEDYFGEIVKFSPVYVRRKGVPVALPHCRTFSDFFSCDDDGTQCRRKDDGERDCGTTAAGEGVKITAEYGDLDQHFTFFWHSARLSRYYTLENRINDQQPPEEMLCIPAMTLGIMENLKEAVDLVDSFPWEVLREMRVQAARNGMDAEVRGVDVNEIARAMVGVAEDGLSGRGLGEEVYLEPLIQRLAGDFCPADRAAEVFRTQGLRGFVDSFRIGP